MNKYLKYLHNYDFEFSGGLKNEQKSENGSG